MQPLRYITADISLAATLALEVKAEAKKKSGQIAIREKGSANAVQQSQLALQPPTSPRKKQAANLAVLASVRGPNTKARKKARRPLESSVGGKRRRIVTGDDGSAGQKATSDLPWIGEGFDASKSRPYAESLAKDDSQSPLKKFKGEETATPGGTVVDVVLPASVAVNPYESKAHTSPPRTPSPIHQNSPKKIFPQLSPTLLQSQSLNRFLPPDVSSQPSRSISPEFSDLNLQRLTPLELSIQRGGSSGLRHILQKNAVDWDDFPSIMDLDAETGDLLVGSELKAASNMNSQHLREGWSGREASSSASLPELEGNDRNETGVEDVDMLEERSSPDEEEWNKWSDYSAYIGEISDVGRDRDEEGFDGYFHTSHSTAINTTAHGLRESTHFSRAPLCFPKALAGDPRLIPSDVRFFSSSRSWNVSVHSPTPVRPSSSHILEERDSDFVESEISEEDEAEAVERLLGIHGTNVASL